MNSFCGTNKFPFNRSTSKTASKTGSKFIYFLNEQQQNTSVQDEWQQKVYTQDNNKNYKKGKYSNNYREIACTEEEKEKGQSIFWGGCTFKLTILSKPYV